jgi:hypothetical protein
MRVQAGRSRRGALTRAYCGVALLASIALAGCGASAGSAAPQSPTATSSTDRTPPPSSAPVTTRPVAVATVMTHASLVGTTGSSTALTTVSTTGAGGGSTSTSDTAGAALPCPTAAELHPSGLTFSTVRCLHGNQWLITRSRFTQNNEMADGVT